MKRVRRRTFTVKEILHWADIYRETIGRWPSQDSGPILLTKGLEKWSAVDEALRQGLRGLPGGSSLAQFLAEHRGARNIQRLPPLSEEQILRWADEHQRRTGAWPTRKSGTIGDSGGEQWQAIDVALHLGARKLPGGSSLARLLARERGVRNRKQLPPLTEEGILAWADAHYQRTGAWPKATSGPVVDAPGETWCGVQVALANGIRHLPGGSSLTRLLVERRGMPHPHERPQLSREQILAWADAWHERSGQWPTTLSGQIPDGDGLTWRALDKLLRKGRRGLEGGSSLSRLLAAQRGLRHPLLLPPLTRKMILTWADAYHERTGKWPQTHSGPIPEVPPETWQGIDAALSNGGRGLGQRSSLARLLARYRGKRSRVTIPPLTEEGILGWADAHFGRTGKWPNVDSGPVADAPGETWRLIDGSLRTGSRRLAGGSSLLKLLVKSRGVRDPRRLPHLTEELILYWAELHFERTGKWPGHKSGPIWSGGGETWSQVDNALRFGKRKLPGGSSLAKFLASQRSAGGSPPALTAPPQYAVARPAARPGRRKNRRRSFTRLAAPALRRW
jgi:hypothetical protein